MITDPSAGLRNRPHPGNELPRAGERLVAVFCVGVLLFSPMILSLFDQGVRTVVLGVPLLYLYVFGAWGMVIALLAWAVERDDQTDPPPAPPPGEQR